MEIVTITAITAILARIRGSRVQKKYTNMCIPIATTTLRILGLRGSSYKVEWLRDWLLQLGGF